MVAPGDAEPVPAVVLPGPVVLCVLLPGYAAVVCDVVLPGYGWPDVLPAVVTAAPDVVPPGDAAEDVSAALVPVVSAALVSTADDSVAD